MNEERDISYGCYLHAVAVQSLSRVQLFVTPWTEACKAFLSLLVSWSLSKFMFIASVMPSTILSPDTLFFCPQSFTASGTFPVNCLFASDDQYPGASAPASVLLVDIQGWSPLRLTGLISLLSKGLSGVFSSTTVRRHQFFGVLTWQFSKCFSLNVIQS